MRCRGVPPPWTPSSPRGVGCRSRGTPFRSDQARIPHIRYDPADDGEEVSVADFTYAYKDALADGVVRPVLFAAYSGLTRWENSAGAVLEATLGDHGLSRTTEQAAWRTALSPEGGWIPHVLAAADHRLDELREGRMPDAGGLVLASNQEQARAYADVLLRLTGTKPVLVLSDEPDSSKRIESFTEDADQRFLVAVRQVAEGVDIPRLAVGVYATSACTPLFFAQAVGRFVRSRRRGETATIFLPAVRNLLAPAAKLEEERDHILAPKKSTVEDVADFEERVDRLEPTGAFTALEATAEFAHLLAGELAERPRDRGGSRSTGIHSARRRPQPQQRTIWSTRCWCAGHWRRRCQSGPGKRVRGTRTFMRR